MDALIRAFASDHDDVIVAADEGGVMDGSDAVGGNADSDGNGSGGAPEDALGDLSD